MIEILKNHWWAFLTVGAILAYFVAIANKISGFIRRVEYLEKRTRDERMDISMLLASNFAVLDGLIELGCDGKVKAARDKLDTYVCQRH
jgi:hypothetical protein